MCNVGHSKHETCYVIAVTVRPGGSLRPLPYQLPTSHSNERENDELVKLLNSKRPTGRVMMAAHCSVQQRAHLCHNSLKVTAGAKQEPGACHVQIKCCKLIRDAKCNNVNKTDYCLSLLSLLFLAFHISFHNSPWRCLRSQCSTIRRMLGF